MTTVTIHQPGYLPWLGFFDKMAQVDIFVLLDDVQYEKNYFDNRNKIKTAIGPMWLTVPVNVSFGQRLNEVTIENKLPWKEKHYKSLVHSYSRTPYFSEHKDFFKGLYARDWEKLIDLNIAVIHYLAGQFGLATRLIRSSELQVAGLKGDRILNICEKLKANMYVSGQFGRNYLDEAKFKDKNIRIAYQEFKHPVYPQPFGDFASALAAIDLLFNCGPISLEVLTGKMQ